MFRPFAHFFFKLGHLLIWYWILKALYNLGSNPYSTCVVQKYFPRSIHCPFFLLMFFCCTEAFHFDAIPFIDLCFWNSSFQYDTQKITRVMANVKESHARSPSWAFRPPLESSFYSHPIWCCVKGQISWFRLWIQFSQHYLLSACLILAGPLAVFVEH